MGYILARIETFGVRLGYIFLGFIRGPPEALISPENPASLTLSALSHTVLVGIIASHTVLTSPSKISRDQVLTLSEKSVELK